MCCETTTEPPISEKTDSFKGEPVLRFEKVAKVYRVYRKPHHRLLEILLRRPRHQAFTALEDIDLVVHRGESVALVGENGAGKSTFLKIATGISEPSRGCVHRRGRVGALLELGAGFHPDFSGRDNVYLNAALLGFHSHQIDEKYPEIVEFAELAPFMEQPVKTYSTGMYIRLAFAIAISIDPEVLVIDEALAVGDVRFQKKCLDRIYGMKEDGKTIFFCSHSMYQVRQLCERAVWIKGGRMEAQGDAYDVVSAYLEYMDCKENGEPSRAPDTAPPIPEAPAPVHRPLPSNPVRLESVEFLDGGGRPVEGVRSGEPFHVRVRGLANGYQGLCSLLFSITLKTFQVYGSSSLIQGKTFAVNGREFSAEIRFPSLALLSGNYYFNVYLSDEEGMCLFDAREQKDLFRVDESRPEAGVVHLEHRWVLP